jgi:hypothetical protein
MAMLLTTLVSQIIMISAANAEKEIRLEEIPAKVRERAVETAPGVDFDRITIETEDGVRVFEFEATGPDGEHIEIDVREDGVLEEIELEKTPAELPAAVVDALNAAHPGADISYVEASIRADGVFIYEIEGRTPSGDRFAIDIREDGRVLSEEDVSTS